MGNYPLDPDERFNFAVNVLLIQIDDLTCQLEFIEILTLTTDEAFCIYQDFRLEIAMFQTWSNDLYF